MDKGKLCYACLAPKDVCTGLSNARVVFLMLNPRTLLHFQSCSVELKIMLK